MLRARGFRVTLATHEHFSEQAQAADLGFLTLVSNAQTETLLRNPDFWHPIKAAVTVARWGAPMLAAQYSALKQITIGSEAVLVSNPGLLAARVMNETHGTPLISILLQPWMVLSSISPPIMMGGLTLPHWAPQFVKAFYWRLFEKIGSSLLVPELAAFRRSLSLPRLDRMFQWWLSPELVIGMFPEWYGNPQADWPGQLALTGFPVEDAPSSGALDPALARFCSSDKPCIAFTFGTGMTHARELFAAGLEACRLLNARALFITKFASQIPHPLPEFARHVPFAPFHQLFPLCPSVVHHGGIGTVAKTLAAGVPQLILPFAFDQLDNAIRVKRLQAGDWLPRKRRSANDIAYSLKKLLTSESQTAAKSLAKYFGGKSGIHRAADLIEAAVTSRV